MAVPDIVPDFQAFAGRESTLTGGSRPPAEVVSAHSVLFSPWESVTKLLTDRWMVRGVCLRGLSSAVRLCYPQAVMTPSTVRCREIRSSAAWGGEASKVFVRFGHYFDSASVFSSVARMAGRVSAVTS
jgi:hypothetical protein